MNILDLLKSYQSILSAKETSNLLSAKIYLSDEHLVDIVNAQKKVDESLDLLANVIADQFPIALAEFFQVFERENVLDYITKMMSTIGCICTYHGVASVEVFQSPLLDLIESIAKPRRERNKYLRLFAEASKVLNHIICKSQDADSVSRAEDLQARIELL